MGEQLCHCGRPLPCDGADHDAMAVYNAERDALKSRDRDQALRAEIEAALDALPLGLPVGDPRDPAWRSLTNRERADALAPFVQAQRMAARRDALTEVRAGIEALEVYSTREPAPGEFYVRVTYDRRDVRDLLDAAEASQ